MSELSRRMIRRSAWNLVAAAAFAGSAAAQGGLGRMPDESAPHEGTWLQWPHHYEYGFAYRNRLDDTWVAMTRALVAGENVHVIAYNAHEQNRITNLLTAAGVSLVRVDFLIRKTNDCWVRDNGPIFVHGASGQLEICDFGFNGWGFDYRYGLDDTVPLAVAGHLGLARRDLDATVLEGGAIEVDGRGVLMATRSSILEPERNPGLSQAQLEKRLAKNLGIVKFIWLDGAPGGQIDVTDTHIDGFARFATPDTIVTMDAPDLLYWALSPADIAILYAASDANGAPYQRVNLPLTAHNVITSYGLDLGYKGSYVNFYVGNTVVLVPAYGDPNDAVAMDLLRPLFPGRTMVGIDVRNLYKNGGMVHCVTQQQPMP